MDAPNVVVLLLLFAAGIGLGLTVGSALAQDKIVRHIRRRAVPAEGKPPFLTELAREIERGEHLR